MSTLLNCPRCTERSLERLRTHEYCYSCNYTPDFLKNPFSEDDLAIPPWVFEVLKTAKPRSVIHQLYPEEQQNGVLQVAL